MQKARPRKKRSQKPFGKRVSYDGITFDSVLEKDVYRMLRTVFRRRDISVHCPLVLFDTSDTAYSEVSGLIKPIKWRVDFFLKPVSAAIEVKGIWSQPDRFKIALANKKIIDGGLSICSDVDVPTKVKQLRVIYAVEPPTKWFDKKSEAYSKQFISLDDFKYQVNVACDIENFLSDALNL